MDLSVADVSKNLYRPAETPFKVEPVNNDDNFTILFCEKQSISN